MARRDRGKALGLAERARRLRHRAEWLAAVLVLLSVPALWLLLQQTDPAAIHPVARPATQARSLPRVPETAQGPPKETVAATHKEEPSSGGCDDLRVLIDRKHALPADYAPADLVPLRDFAVPTLGGNARLRREAAESLARLVSAAAASGEELSVASAYRSYRDQRLSYGRLVSIYGADADKTSAPPGHSQHQLGTAVDFTNGSVGYEVRKSFGRTGASRWLKDHASEYGFVLAYPSGKEAETGYGWEPWHYRYVGADNARRVRESGLGLQGFLMREGVPPRC